MLMTNMKNIVIIFFNRDKKQFFSNLCELYVLTRFSPPGIHKSLHPFLVDPGFRTSV